MPSPAAWIEQISEDIMQDEEVKVTKKTMSEIEKKIELYKKQLETADINQAVSIREEIKGLQALL